jgi:carboxylesterase type B
MDDSLDNFEGVTMWNPNTNISEDCLYINIWTPKVRLSQSNKAVMLWIFGGGFYAGTNTLEWYDGRIMAAEGDVVVVSMQYRVGVMGFLYLDISGAPGNVGLLDQQLAMQWIFNNIQDYGGDNSRITIFGESAGAACVSLHMLSPLSKETFQRAIMQSSTALSPWACDDPKVAKSKSLDIASRVGCKSDVTEEVLFCLKKVSFAKLTNAMWTIEDDSVLLTPLAPTIDGYFLRQHPLDLLADGNFKDAPILIGVNHDEGAYFLPFSLPNLNNISKNSINTKEKYLQSVRQLLHNDDELTAEIVAHEYKYPYQYSRKQSYMDILDDILGDYCFICPTLSLALSYTEKDLPVYFYQFRHVTSKSPWPKWMGALHGYEIDTVFGLPMNDSKGYTLAEKELAQRVVHLWTNFGKTG